MEAAAFPAAHISRVPAYGAGIMHLQVIGRITVLFQKKLFFLPEGGQPPAKILQGIRVGAVSFLRQKKLFCLRHTEGGDTLFDFPNARYLLVDFILPRALNPVIMILTAVILTHDRVILFVGQRHILPPMSSRSAAFPVRQNCSPAAQSC